MQSLLRWSIENSDLNAPPAAPAQNAAGSSTKLDPGIIDAILGKSDAELMKEALTIAVDESRGEDERVQALDDFEMLVEQIDNANNLEKMQMWKPLHDLLLSHTSSDLIKTQTLWIIGTAVQNNPSAQASYLKLSPIPSLLAFVSARSTPSAKLRSKAVYALSGLLKHNAAAVRQLDEVGSEGWSVLRDGLEDSDITVRRKVAFLFNGLLIPSQSSSSNGESSSSGPALHNSPPSSNNTPVHPNSHASMVADPSSTDTSSTTVKAMQEYNIAGKMVESLVSPVPHGPDGEQEGDEDFEEKVVGALYTYIIPCRTSLTSNQKRSLATYFNRADQQTSWGLTEQELQSLKSTVGI